MSNVASSIRWSAGLLALALITGCGSGGGGSTTTSGTPAITVAISPLTPVAMVAGATQSFTATVANDSANGGVAWTASAGTISSSGLYTAATPVVGTSATVTATSKTDPTKSASVTIPLTPAAGSNAISVNPLVPTRGTLGMGGTLSFNATVANDPANQGVSWSIGSGPGKLTAATTSSVAYTSPATGITTTTTVTLTATSIADPTKSASAAIAVNPISVSVSPTSTSLSAGGSQSFVPTVLNDNANAGVLWTVTGGGSLSATSTFSGVATNYTAPSPVTNSTVTITATSKEDPTKSASATVTLSLIGLNPISPSVATLGIGQSQVFSDTVSNDPSNAGVRWSITAGPGTLSGASNSAVTYNAPAIVISSPTSATLTATSVANPGASTSVTILLTPVAVNLNTPSAITLDGDGAQTTTVSASITGDGPAAGATFTVTSAGGTMSPGSVAGNSPSSAYTAPVVTAAKNSTITIASITDPTQTQTVTVRLNVPMTFTTPLGALTAASTGTPYPSTPILVAGGTGTKTFTIAAGALPAGLSLSSAGVISGTATASAGTYNFTTHVIDQSSVPAAINGAFSITVGGPGLTWVTPAAGTQTYTVGTAITPITLSATGGTGAVTYSVNSGSLPQGLQIVGSQITGTPTAPTVVAGNSINFLATDSATPTHATAVSSNVVLIANPIALAVTSTLLPTGTVGVPYSYQLISTGGTGAITWSLSSGSLTGTGLSLSSSGLVSGTPTATETGLSLTFQAQDSATNQQQTKTAPLPLNVNNALAITTSSLPIAIPSTAYNQSLTAIGGSGSGYTWTVMSGAAGASSLATLNLSVSSAGVISGTPTATGTANFTVQVKDSANNTASASLSVSTSPPLTLPAPNPSSLGTAGITLTYSGAINATGGIGGYTWTVNSTPVPTNGSSVTLSDGLSVSNSGGSASLSISGTPTATGTVSFAASVNDSTGSIAGPFTYTIAVSNVYTVGGSINTRIGCGSASLTGVTVSINTNPVQTTTTGANGSFSFINVPNGTYTITPSLAGAIFSPATESVTVNNNNLSATSFTANLAYTVTGTVNYTGTQTGQIYLAMNPVGTCGGGTTGTSIPTAGPFTIRGVPPGTYTLQAFMDNAGNGISNASNPVGSTSGINVSTANLAGASVTLSDPATVTLTTAPTLKGVSGFNNGAVAEYTPITNSAGVEMATYYTFQWSTTPTFTTIAGSKRFPATGTHLNIWFLNTLTNGSVYYFRAYGTSGGTVAGPISPVVGPILIGAPTVGNVVTGSVSFAAPATGPLYAGFFDQGTGAFYGQYFAAPVSAQPYTIQVPTGSNYLFIGVVDQNNDGAIDTNDITNTGNGSSQPITSISGPTSTNLILPSANGIATVTTQNYQVISSGSTSQSYNLSFRVNGLIKQPVTVTLASGPNLITPVDIAICGGAASNCGQGFQITFNLNSTSPNVGDSYTFNVTYSDGTTGTLTAAVTAVLAAFPTNLAPQTGTSVSATPTFTWTDPISASNYSYQFYINDPSGNAIWNIPGSNSTSSGFSSATSSIVWGTDPTGGSSTPTVGSLTLGANYAWQITVQDSLGNTAATQVQYQP